MSEINFPAGLFYNMPHAKAPDFVLASIAIRPDVFIEWLKQQKTNDKGYVRIQALRGRDGKPYCKLDDYGTESSPRAPQQATEPTVSYDEEISVDEIPF